MGVVTISSSSSRCPIGLAAKWLPKQHFTVRKTCILAFKTDGKRNSAFLAAQEPVAIPVDSVTKPRRTSKRSEKKSKKPVKAVSVDEAPSCSLDLDYNAVAASLESIFKLSPSDLYELEKESEPVPRPRRTRKKVQSDEKSVNEREDVPVVRITRNRPARLNLDKRIALRRKKAEAVFSQELGRKSREDVDWDVDRLVRDYSASTDLVSLDWKKMKIPDVLPSTEHTWLFKLMQPMKAILEIKESLSNDLSQDPTDGELAGAVNMSVSQMRRQVEVGRAARNKLIKHNLRLILFVINKYYHEFGNGPKFPDLCQAGVKGLIVSIDRFEPKRGFRLSTYGLFWIRHAVIRSLTVSSFARVPFGIESVRQEIQRAKFELMFELERLPTDEEIVARVGISADRYHDIIKASKQVLSLHSRHIVTQEEFIKGISDVDGVGGDKRRQTAVLRLALDDVLDSLKPKESMVIRQRYGLDGKGDRTLGEIAGNLSISREMVRKHEVKALMKLKHPTRVDYLRRHIR